ncbi:MAG: hypothetical protein WC850_04735 [Candidatus Gracilibacteria bacterium]
MINISLFEEFKRSKSKILAVTKYWDTFETNKIIQEIENTYPEILFGIGENRIEKIIEKGISRENMNFIGQIQSKKLEKIVSFCSTIHSLDNIKYALLIDKLSKEKNIKTKVFLQVKLDKSKDSGIEINEFTTILKEVQKLGNIEILGISGMGTGEFTIKEKENEFELLINLRDKYLPGKLISAGTSRDYEIALKYGIEVIRIGNKIIN